MNITQLLEERARVRAEQVSITDTAEAEGRELTAEDRQKWDTCDTRIDELTANIEIAEKDAKRAKQGFNDPATDPGTPEHRDEPEDDDEKRYADAYATYMREGMSGLSREEQQTLRKGFVDAKELRAQGVGTNSAGGYTVPTGFRNAIVERMKDYGAVQNVATVITTDSGQALPWPTNDDTGNVGALLAENTQIAELDLVLGTAQLDAYKYTSKLTRVSLELIQDSAFDIEGFVQRKHGERLGRILNQHFTSGTGSSQPNGIVYGATSGVTAASTTAITADELLDLVHSVDPAYRARGKFMLSDTALKGIRKLKDSTGQYLWQPSVQAGVAASLFGYPYVINQDMAVPATGVKSVLFGDFEAGYVIRIVKAMQNVVFAERYMDYFQMAYTTFCRADAEVQDSYAYRALTQA